MQWIEEKGEIALELFNEILSRRKMDTRSEAQIKQDVNEDIQFVKNQNKMEVSISKKEKLAMRMYDDYCESVGGKAFNGDDLPKSDELFNDTKKQIQAMGWVKAAETAIDFLEYNL